MVAASPELFVKDLSRSYGQVLIGTFIGTALWGTSCLQTLIYFVTYKSDKWYLKTFVALLWIMDTLHELLCLIAVYRPLIPRFGDVNGLSHYAPESMYQVIVLAVVGAMAQGFFTWPVWSLVDKNWIYVTVLVPIIIAQMAGFLLYGSRGIGQTLAFLNTPGMRKLGLSNNIIVFIVDLSIAIMMCILLRRGRTGFAASDRISTRLINAAVSTGVCTAFFAFFTIITLAVWPEDLIYAVAQIPLSPLYCNAVLANLNSRKYIGGINTSINLTSTEQPSCIQLEQMPSSEAGGTCGNYTKPVDSVVGTVDKYAHYDQRTLALRVTASTTTLHQ